MNDRSNYAIRYNVSANTGAVTLSNWTQVQGGRFLTTAAVGNPTYSSGTLNIISPGGTAIDFGASGLLFMHTGTVNIGNAVSPALTLNGPMNINTLNVYDYATSGLAINGAVGRIRLNKVTCSNNSNSGTTGLILANSGSGVVDVVIDEIATLGNATGISFTAPSSGGLAGRAVIKRSRSTDTTARSYTFGSTSSLYADFRIFSQCEGGQAASNNPSAGSSVAINLSDTLGIVAGQLILVTDGSNTEECTVASVVTNTSVTVSTLAHSYTAPIVYNLENTIIRMGGGTIQTVLDSNRHTASGKGWKLSPTSSYRDTSFPVTMPLAQVPVSAGTAVTVSAYMKYSASAVSGQIRIPANSLAGVGSSDLVSSSVSSSSYVQKSITFTPLETGVVEVIADAWYVSGTSDSIYIDDFDCSQV